MPRYIVTGSYTASAIRGMIEHPSDREAAARGVIEAAGGRLESYFATTGAFDFLITVTIDDAEALIATLMATGASGAVSNLTTAQAFTSQELIAAQKRAGKLVKSYKAPA